MSDDQSDTIFICAFCGADSTEVEIMVAGPICNICDECISVCVEAAAYGMREIRKSHSEQARTRSAK